MALCILVKCNAFWSKNGGIREFFEAYILNPYYVAARSLLSFAAIKSGGQRGYFGHCVNLSQPIEELASPCTCHTELFGQSKFKIRKFTSRVKFESGSNFRFSNFSFFFFFMSSGCFSRLQNDVQQ